LSEVKVLNPHSGGEAAQFNMIVSGISLCSTPYTIFNVMWIKLMKNQYLRVITYSLSTDSINNIWSHGIRLWVVLKKQGMTNRKKYNLLGYAGKDCKRLGKAREKIRDHLADLATLPNPLNADLSRCFTVLQAAEKHGWIEPMVWSLALEGKADLERVFVVITNIVSISRQHQ